MTQRERFLKTAAFNEPDRAFLLAPWWWEQTLERWHNEGLPRDLDYMGIVDFFNSDCERDLPVLFHSQYGTPYLFPPFDEQSIEETDIYIIKRDAQGNTLKIFKDDRYHKMPQWLGYPMSNRKDWENVIKPRFIASDPGRFPKKSEWTAIVENESTRDYALGMWCGSFYGWPRGFMGVEALSYMFYDDPALIHEMCNYIADFWVEILTKVLLEIQLDYAFIWEDMACKTGPLCSPATYREFMADPLKRITSVLHKHGVHNIIIDSDGNNDIMIPLWLECGITGLRPFEIAANSDPVRTRREYGKDLIIQGGIDKRALAGTKEDIDREILSKVPWLCIQGGYFPQVDHLTPPDVSLENYSYYSNLLKAVTEDPERYLYESVKRGFWD